MLHPLYVSFEVADACVWLIRDLGQLVTDDKTLCKLVYERGALTKLSNLLKSITPNEPPSEWDADEPETLSALREV